MLLFSKLMHLNDSSSITLHLKTYSLPKSNFWKILVENSTIIEHRINKLKLQILEDLHIKTKKPRINAINFDNSDTGLKYFFDLFFSNILYFFIIVYSHW